MEPVTNLSNADFLSRRNSTRFSPANNLILSDRVRNSISVFRSAFGSGLRRGSSRLIHEVIPESPISMVSHVEFVDPVTNEKSSVKLGVRVLNGTLELLRSKSIDMEQIQRAGHILDCLLSGIGIIYPSIGKEEWDLLPSLFLFYCWVVEKRWVQELKFHLCSLFNDHTSQENPETISSIHRPGTLLIGPIMRRLSQKLAYRNKRAWIFFNTILNGFKKGLPIVEPNTVSASALKHCERLSRVGTTPKWLLEWTKKVGRVVFNNSDMIYKNPEFGVKEGINLHPLKEHQCVSQNSCVESSRSTLGPLGHLILRELGDEREFDIEKLSQVALGFDSLVSCRYSPMYGYHELRARFVYSEIVNEYRKDVGVRDHRGFGFDQDHADVKFILEPLKVRTITSMGMFHNAIYPEIQQQMWSAMQKFPQFCLTGRCVEERDVNDLVSRTQEMIPEWFGGWFNKPQSAEKVFHPYTGLKWVSGDYSGATDSCHLDLSDALIETVSDDRFIQDLLRHNLSGQNIDYSKCGLKEYPSTFKMTNGQLMGSRFSFPLLCVFNLAIYHYCLEKVTKRKWDIKDLPVLVNGDDILFLATDELVARWESCLPLAGLEKSVGKNYVSDLFCTVNSTLFLRDVLNRGIEIDRKNVLKSWMMTKVPYVNMGLVFGMKKQPFGKEGESRKKVEEDEALSGVLKGAFAQCMDLPLDCKTRFEACVRNHRPALERSYLSSRELGFHDGFTPQDKVRPEFREELLKDLYLWCDSKAKTRDSGFVLDGCRVYDSHSGVYGKDNGSEEGKARLRERINRSVRGFSDSRLWIKWAGCRLQRSLYGDRDSRKNKALRGLPEHPFSPLETYECDDRASYWKRYGTGCWIKIKGGEEGIDWEWADECSEDEEYRFEADFSPAKAVWQVSSGVSLEERFALEFKRFWLSDLKVGTDVLYAHCQEMLMLGEGIMEGWCL